MAIEKTVLTKNQRLLLAEIVKNKIITDTFYLGGGTALAEFYLKHRRSEDLDFFTENEFDPFFISTFFKSIQKKIGIKGIDFQQSFNRNLFFCHCPNEVLKVEFTFFPFPRVESKKNVDGMQIDSLLDIAINKVFTIYQKPRSRDFIDLYLIVKKTGWSLPELIKKAKIKFDCHIDFLQLGTQFLKAEEVKDYPKMLIKIAHSSWQKFFITEAKKFKKNVVS